MRGAAPATVQSDWDATAWAVAQVRAAASPAFLVRGDGTLVAANAAAEPLCGRGELPSSLRALIIEARLKDCAQAVKVSVPDRAGGAARCFDLAILPVPVGQVFVVGREITLEMNAICFATSRSALPILRSRRMRRARSRGYRLPAFLGTTRPNCTARSRQRCSAALRRYRLRRASASTGAKFG
jgi:hypothetical protein